VSAVPDRLATALADRYRLERELGQGGMATMDLAEVLEIFWGGLGSPRPSGRWGVQ
jgi:hypothetical protein